MVWWILIDIEYLLEKARLPTCHVCFDNYNDVQQKKAQTGSKAAITHIGTAFMVRQDTLIHPPNGTMIKTSSGILFYVILCEEVSLVK